MNVFEIEKPKKEINSLSFYLETGSTLFTDEGKWFISNCESQEKANELIAKHNPPKPSEPTVAEKLASVGLSLDELKAALA